MATDHGNRKDKVGNRIMMKNNIGYLMEECEGCEW
jgi:hypothetical protein